MNFVNAHNPGEILSRRGFMVDAVEMLRIIMGFKIKAHYEFGDYGSKLENGSYTGIIEQVLIRPSINHNNPNDN